jgi:N,N'-diacetyllegionaminate synthase
VSEKITFIAEICQNHCGKRNLLKKLVERCAKAGAHIIKTQIINSANLTFRPQFEKGLKFKNKIICIKRPYKIEKKRLKKLDLKLNDYRYFSHLCKLHKVKSAITCFTRKDLKLIKKIKFDYIKIASYDCASFQFVDEITDRYRNLIVSTGATYDDEIAQTVKILKKKKINYSLLHCITKYPTKINDLNLNRINFLRKFSKKVGFSDHSLSIIKGKENLATFLAIYKGAQIIERHIRITDHKKTKDGIVSILPEQIREIINFSRLNRKKQKTLIMKIMNSAIKISKGKKFRDLTNEELLNRDYYRGRFASVIKKNRYIFNWETNAIS